MIKLFRKIRRQLLGQKKFGNYLLYAIGEIVLVVLGILIALNINNWNEVEKERMTEQNYLRRLQIDLENDYETLIFSKGLSMERLKQIDLLFKVNDEQGLYNHNAKQIVESIEKVTWRSYLPLSRIVYNELLNSGKMSLIQSEKLRELLSNYYGSADHWEMILNLEDAQKQFSHATAGLLSKEILSAIENSESTDLLKSSHHQDIDIHLEDIDEIIMKLASNKNAMKWLPKIYHYHVLADKVIIDLANQNETLKKLVQSELNN